MIENHADVPTSVYRYFDAFGVLIYVGITARGATRNGEHNAGKAWWPYVVRQEVDHFPSRVTAHRREVELITRYRPPFNSHHNPDRNIARDAYLAFRAAYPSPPTAHEVFAETDGRLPLRVTCADLGKIQFSTLPEHVDLVNSLDQMSGQPKLEMSGGVRIGHVLRWGRVGACLTLDVQVRKGITLANAALRVKPTKSGYKFLRVQIFRSTDVRR